MHARGAHYPALALLLTAFAVKAVTVEAATIDADPQMQVTDGALKGA